MTKNEIPEIDLAENRKHKVPYDFKINENDNDNVKVEKIYSKFPEFVVYRTKTVIRIDINDNHEKNQELTALHQKLGVDLAKIYSLLPDNIRSIESINRLIGRAITVNIGGDAESAKAILAHAVERVVKLKTIKGRLQYAASAMAVVCLICVLSWAMGLQQAPLLLNMALCGALGGIMSIALSFSSLEIDVDASAKVNCLIGFSRILIAVTASIFAYFAIKSDVAFSFVSKAPENAGFYMIAMVAGFAEMLVPNIMSNIGKENRDADIPIIRKSGNEAD
ncbi:hypothetical protein [Paraburkholderia sp. C35]|uniref:hypothetical protein n=1 Tax=Paraburkholderia sp. C35 TaxID=2126993 RepID=UPI0013A558A6|nr:hypothetical protein [Paraburkholderia sp. C35]